MIILPYTKNKILVLNNIIIFSDDKKKGVVLYIVCMHVCIYVPRKQDRMFPYKKVT